MLAAEPVPDDEEAVDAAAQSGFQAWLSTYRAHALAAGIRPTTLDDALSGLSYSPRVVALDRAQPDDSAVVSTARFADYLARRLEPVREGRGLSTKGRYQARLSSLEAATGVPQSIVLGIWGMESSYGAVIGSFDVIRSLASLAYDGRRRALFTRELDAALDAHRPGPRDAVAAAWLLGGRDGPAAILAELAARLWH